MRTRPKSIVRPCSWVGCGGEECAGRSALGGVRWEECAGECAGGDGGRRKERQGLAGLSRRGWSKHHRRRRRPRAAPSPRRRLRYRASYVRPISVLFPLLGPPPGVRSTGAPLACVGVVVRAALVRAPSSARRRPLLHRRSPTPAAFAQHRGRRPAGSQCTPVPTSRHAACLSSRPHAVSSYSCQQLRQSACHCLNTQCTPLALTRPVSVSTVHSL